MGPLLVWLARRWSWSTVSVDSFCVITISGFALLHLLPECVEQAGWLVLPLALVGFLAPTLAERSLERPSRHLRRFVLFLALLGMAAHDTLDGLFIHMGAHHHGGGPDHAHGHHHEMTAWAVILHRIPEGIGIWWIVPRTLGMRATILVSIVAVAGTLVGFFLGHHLEDSSTSLSLLQALLAGSLLHVVFHAHIPAPRDRQRWHIASVAGAVAALVVLWFVIHDHFPGDQRPMQVFMTLAIESAPALIVAYLLVGLCQAFMPMGWLSRMTKGSTLSQAVRGVAVGLPLPVCSCGVVPIYRELVRQGSSLVAALAFLVATPELEIAAVLLTWQLMGGEVAIARVAMAAVLALVVGILVGKLVPKQSAATIDEGAMPEQTEGSFGSRLMTALRFGFGPAVDNTATWILMGLLLSAIMMPYVSEEWIASLPAGIDVPIAALLGLPLYVCATGSTPLAAILLINGLSPGAVLALLLTGPATNMTTFGVLRRLHGGRTAILFALTMWLGAILLGYLVNAVVPSLGAGDTVLAPHEHGSFSWFWLGALGLLFGLSLLRQGVRPFIERLFESPANLENGEPASCCVEEDEAKPPHEQQQHHHHHHH